MRLLVVDRKLENVLLRYWSEPGAVTHVYNTTYSGGRDWEDLGSRPAWAKHSQDPVSVNKSWTRWHASVIPAIQKM
jgi:hypothetical protein